MTSLDLFRYPRTPFCDQELMLYYEAAVVSGPADLYQIGLILMSTMCAASALNITLRKHTDSAFQ